MINVARVGVDDHTTPRPKPRGRSRNLINKAAPTDKQSTRTAKMAALLVSVNFVNIPNIPSLAEVLARQSYLERQVVGGVASPDLGRGQVAALRLHAAVAMPRNEGSILLTKEQVCATEHEESISTS